MAGVANDKLICLLLYNFLLNLFTITIASALCLSPFILTASAFFIILYIFYQVKLFPFLFTK